MDRVWAWVTERPREWWSLVMVYVSILLLAVSGILYTGYVSKRDTHKFCNFVITLDEAFSAGPPTSPAGKRIRDSIKQLRIELGCD